MARPIELRAWCPTENRMLYADENYCFRVHADSVSYQPHFENPAHSPDTRVWYNSHPAPGEILIYVMQFTGHYDMNRVKVWEDDMAKWACDWDFKDDGYEKEDRIFKTKKQGNRKFYPPEVGRIVWEGDEYAHFVLSPTRVCLNPVSLLIECIGNFWEHPELSKEVEA